MYPTDRRQLNTERQIYLAEIFLSLFFQSVCAHSQEILSAPMFFSLNNLSVS